MRSTALVQMVSILSGGCAACWMKTLLIRSYRPTEKGFRWTITSRFAGGPATYAKPVFPTDCPLFHGGFRCTFVLCSTIRFAWRHLDIVPLHGGAIDRPPTLQECARVTLMSSLRGRGSALVLSMMSRILAGLGERPQRLLPVFRTS